MERRYWKKIFGLILISTMLIFALSACSKGGDDAGAPDPTTVPVVATDDEASDMDEEPATPTPTPEPKDLKGQTIVIADWWTTDPNPEPKNTREEDTYRYREEFMDEYNFTITRENIGAFGEYQEIVITSIMAGDPAADVFVMHAEHPISALLQQNLLYPLDTLENFDFTEEKWNTAVTEMLSMDGHVYGMATGRMEPRLGVFWNKRLFEEAGIDPNLPYDLQAKDEWTWEALEDLAKRNTRDLDNDGIPDVYGIASFSKDFFRGCVFSNGAEFIGYKDGKFYNATSDPKFLKALEWGWSLYEKGYHHPLPDPQLDWQWFLPTYIEGKAAMQCAEQYKVNNYKDMEDDWGFVIFPKGPSGEMMTAFTNNTDVMPVTLDKERAEDVAFAYNLYTNVTPGYEDEDWKTQYYPLFRDARAVEETLPLFYEPEHGIISKLFMIPGIDYGDVTYDLDAGALSPAETVEKVQANWQAFIDEANGDGPAE